MSAKITIIGAGSVGSTIAYTLAMENSGASEIVLIDINKEKVLGEVMDIAQGTFFRDPVSIVAGDYEDAKDSDIVIITSGIARRPGQTRIELTQTNVNILKVAQLDQATLLLLEQMQQLPGQHPVQEGLGIVALIHEPVTEYERCTVSLSDRFI